MSDMTRDAQIGSTPTGAGTPARARDDWERLGSYRDETYYGLPAVKASHYGWYVVTYFFIGGLASAAQFLATVIEFLGMRDDRPITRAGRYIALSGALVSPGLLIADLHTPQRWYNMLRIYRHTSPMSIGSWALTTFGTLSGFTAVGQAISDLFGWRIGDWLARIAGLPAALAGGVVSIYTGTLLAATSNPLWSSAFPFISSLFAGSAASTATAALSLTANVTPTSPAARRRLTWFAWVSGLTELVYALLIEGRLRRRKMDGYLDRSPVPGAWHVGVLGLGILAPLVIHTFELVTGRESRRLSSAASVLTLVGGFLLRAVFVFGGNAASRDPHNYFRVTQAGQTLNGPRRSRR